jgi:hypothetical protein
VLQIAFKKFPIVWIPASAGMTGLRSRFLPSIWIEENNNNFDKQLINAISASYLHLPSRSRHSGGCRNPWRWVW